MDIVQFTRKFQEVEIQNDFFSEKDANGLAWWDIVRHDIFYAIYYELSDIKNLEKPPVERKRSTILLQLFTLAVDYAKYLLITSSRKPKYLCYTCSRYKDLNNNNVDHASYDVVSLIAEQSLIIETNPQEEGKFTHPLLYNTGVTIAHYKNKLFGKVKPDASTGTEISKVLQKEFGTSRDLNNIISKLIARYYIEYNYYRRFFTRMHPEHIFLVQNGIQKALFAAARSVRIPTTELQHGLIGYVHPAYSYPKAIVPGMLNTLPDEFFSLADFWLENTNYPVKHHLSVGNNFYAKPMEEKTDEYQLTVIMADIYALDFINFIDKLLQTGFKERIAIKLHPNQLGEVNAIRSHFAAFKQVDVVYTEQSINKLMSHSKAILAIQSTVVYEALQNKVKVYIYKIKDYKTHEDIFDDLNVYLIETIEELRSTLSAEYKASTVKEYFKKFDPVLFKTYLEKSTD